MLRFLAIICFVTVQLIALSQTDSVFSESYIRKKLVSTNAGLEFVRVNDSIAEVSQNRAKDFILKVREIAKSNGNTFMEGMADNNLGVIYLKLSMFSDAYKAFESARVKFIRCGEEKGIHNALSNLGNVFFYTGDYKKALFYSFKAFDQIKSGLDKGMYYDRGTTSCLNIGGIYGTMGNITLARMYFQKALEYYQLDPQRDSLTKAYIYNNIGDTYDMSASYDTAMAYYKISMDLKLKYGTKFDKNEVCEKTARQLWRENKRKESLDWLLKGEAFLKGESPSSNLRNTYQSLSVAYGDMGDYKNQNVYLKKLLRVDNYLDSTGKATEIMNSELKAEFKVKQFNDSLQNVAMLTIKDNEIQQKKRESVFGIIVLVIVCVLALFIFNRYRIERKQKQEIEAQKKLVTEKNREITESITYAKNLQDALIPHTEELPHMVSDAFVLYKPKDIVAGDFYWWHSFKDQGRNRLLVAAADSTGHGVPGAMVSVVCINALNRAVNEFNLSEPNEVLQKTDELVNETFSKNKKQVNDGMDVSLLLIDYDQQKIHWAGANNRLLYFSNSILTEVKPNKLAIGKSFEAKVFYMQEIQFAKGDIFYLLTDGFGDQFGGTNDKKMGFAALRKKIEQTAGLPLAEQKTAFENHFTAWKGNYEQTDDVTLIGIKI